jgi:hypothetical protein
VSTRTFYSSRSGSYNEIQGPTGKILCGRALIARVVNDVFNGVGHTRPCCLPRCTRLGVWRRAVESFGTVAVLDEWSIALVLYCSHTIAALSDALETCVCTLGTCVPNCTGMTDMLFFMLEIRGP